jgi:hypothetical protein
MDKTDTIVPATPPAPTAKAVREHRRTLELSLDALKAGAAQLALASARGEPGAQEALAALHGKIQATEFEIGLNYAAVELGSQEDAAAEAAWRASLQTMDPAAIIDGIGKEQCCKRCTPGVPGGCVISAAAPHAGGICVHPVRERDMFSRDANGKRQFHYRHSARVSAVFDAACEKLKVRGEYA